MSALLLCKLDEGMHGTQRFPPHQSPSTFIFSATSSETMSFNEQPFLSFILLSIFQISSSIKEAGFYGIFIEPYHIFGDSFDDSIYCPYRLSERQSDGGLATWDVVAEGTNLSHTQTYSGLNFGSGIFNFHN
jgi:hypothetical protein